VDQVVVMPAEQHQVLQGGLAAVGPVLDVVQCRSVKRGGVLLQKISPVIWTCTSSGYSPWRAAD
jgi:hypothetical protein